MSRSDYDFTEDVFLQEDPGSSIAEHATQCLSMFRQSMVTPDIVPDPSIMDDQLARFTLWTSNMDVFGPPNVSLDYRLRFSPTIVEIIHQLLDLICHALKALKPINDPLQSPRIKRRRTPEPGDPSVTSKADDYQNDSDSSGDGEEANISKITHTIGGTVTRLFRLSNAVRRSAKASRAQRIAQYRGNEEADNAIAELRLYTECYIRFRFPNTPDSLLSALVEANAMRLRRLYYQQAHRRRIALTVQKIQDPPSAVQLPKINDKSETIRFAPSSILKPPAIQRILENTGPPPAPASVATTARETTIAALYAKSTAEVPRAKSVLVNNKLSYPPIPQTDDCPYCGGIVEFKQRSRSRLLWQNHILVDLEPFICLFTNCLELGEGGTGPQTFETSKAWISHMQNAHGHRWVCRAPSHDPAVFDQELEFLVHSVEEHNVPGAHARTLCSAARRPVLDKVLGCPFGDNFEYPEHVESSAVFATEALQLHVAAHIKEIALLALQKIPNGTEEDEDYYVESDHVVDDDISGFPILRQSMYSVLDDEDVDFEDDLDAPEDVSNHLEGVITPDIKNKDSSGPTELQSAVQAGDPDRVRDLISEGANLRQRDDEGRTVWYYACTTADHDTDMIGLLLDAGRNTLVNLRDDHGQTALHYAAECNFVDGIHTLVKRGAETLLVDNCGFSPCLWAVVAGSADAVRELLVLDPDQVDSFSGLGISALSWAASLGRHDIVELLVNRAADLSMAQNMQMLPLAAAAAFGNLDIMRMLLEHGASPNDRDQDGWSAMHWAAEEGHLKCMSLLLEHGADIDSTSSYGTSPLHCAANGGHETVVRWLLQHGSDSYMSTCHGWTPLHHAAFMGYSGIVQCLLEDPCATTSASQQDNHGWSVLHLAIHSRDLDSIRALVESSVIADLRQLFDENGLTAEEWLDLGLRSHSYKKLSDSAWRKSRSVRAVTGLRLAVVTGSAPMVRFLLQKNSYTNANGENSGRRTALYYAAKTNLFHITDLLLNNGADPDLLPRGRKSWEEFVSDEDLLRRLTRAGYVKQDPDPVITRLIQLALQEQDQLSLPDRSSSLSNSIDQSFFSARSSMSDQLTPHIPSRPTTHRADISSQSVPPPSASLSQVQDPSASSVVSDPLSSVQQGTEDKNEARSVSSSLTALWKRLTGR